jgi:iron(III) transport system permease protein
VTIGGKGGRRDLISLGRWRWVIAGCILLYVAATVIVPMLAIIAVSLQGFWRADSFTFTLANYHFVLFEQIGAAAALVHSLVLATVGATCAVTLALAIGHLTLRHRGKVNTALDVIAALPLGIPSIVFGTGMLITFLKLPIVLYGTLVSLLIAYVAHTLPITMRPIASSYIQLDGTLLESASMSGASGPRVMADVILPLLRTGITSAWGLTFVLLLRELPISMMLTTPGNSVISTYLFNLFDTQTFPAVAALAVVLFVVGICGLIVIGLATRLWRRYV